MNVKTAKVTEITELTIVERARKALSIEHTEDQLQEMAQRCADVKAIDDDATYELVKQGQRDLRVVRLSIEGAGKLARSDARAFSSAVIEEEKRLIGIIKPEEERLKTMKKEVDDRVKAEREYKRDREKNRIAAIEADIDDIRQMAILPAGSTVDTLRAALTEALAVEIDESYAEYEEPANIALAATIGTLTAALEQQEAFVAQAAKMAEQQAQMAEQQRKMDEQAAEQQAEADRVQAEKAEVERKRQAAEDERLALIRKENERLEREKTAHLAKEQAERERLEAEKAADAESARLEALRPEKDRLVDWLKKLRFIDGVELHDTDLMAIQSDVLGKIAHLSIEAVQLVEGICATTNDEGAF